MNYDMDIDSEVFPVSGECSFWLHGESCGATTCHECGADAAAALVANATASITGVVVAARHLAAEGDDPHDVTGRIFTGRVGWRGGTGVQIWTAWLWGLWDAAINETSYGEVRRPFGVFYGLGRIAFLAWRNAREENRRV